MTPFALSLVVLGVLAHFLPEWTRPDFFFGVTIDPALRLSDAGRHVTRSYRTILWTATIAAIPILLTTGPWEAALVQAGGFLVALSVAHRRVLVYAAAPPTTIEVDLHAPTEKFPGGILAALVPLLSSALLAWWASRHWDQLPLRIPTHIGLHGADRWVTRTTAGVYGFIGAQAALSMLCVLSAWGILHWSRRLSGRKADAALDRRFRSVNVDLFLAVAYLLAGAAWISLLKPEAAGLIGVAVMALIVVWYLLLIQLNRRTTTAALGDRTPDACWKLGMFYVNRADPSFFVAKRFGIGYTVNFGNRWAWVALGAILIAAVSRSLVR